MPSAAEQLEGHDLEGGWKVGVLEPRSPTATGGNFSQTYKATSGDKIAFVKALDFRRAFTTGANFTKVLQEVLALFNFEVEMLRLCEERRMDRVVRAIGSGVVDIDGNPFNQVPYLIFEAADRDIRKHLDDPIFTGGIAWKIRSLHQIATGLKQLHTADVVHQDVKPSNILVFGIESKASISKLADLGRASKSTGFSPFDHMDWAGDPKYAPPEVHFGFIQNDWHDRRISYDLYMLGSLLCFLFSRVTANSSLFMHLDSQFWPGNWNGTFDEVLTYLDHAFAETKRTLAAQIPPVLAKDLVPIYEMLCNPDPRKRGYPGSKRNSLALERFISVLDRLAKTAASGKYGVM